MYTLYELRSAFCVKNPETFTLLILSDSYYTWAFYPPMPLPKVIGAVEHRLGNTLEGLTRLLKLDQTSLVPTLTFSSLDELKNTHPEHFL